MYVFSYIFVFVFVIRRCVVKSLKDIPHLELELHGLQGGGRLDGPGAPLFGHLGARLMEKSRLYKF